MAVVAGPGQPHLGVEVRTIEVDQTTMVVDDLGELLDARLEDTVGGGVGDHGAGEILGMLVCPRPEIVHIDVAQLVGLHHHNLHPGHD